MSLKKDANIHSHIYTVDTISMTHRCQCPGGSLWSWLWVVITNDQNLFL